VACQSGLKNFLLKQKNFLFSGKQKLTNSVIFNKLWSTKVDFEKFKKFFLPPLDNSQIWLYII